MAAPSLHELARMPFPASLLAVRKFYDPLWAVFNFEDGPREIRVSLDYEVTREERFSIVVEASSTAEAEQIARAELKDREGRVDILYVELRDPHEITVPHPSLFETLQ
jgi:hypothetical protein